LIGRLGLERGADGVSYLRSIPAAGAANLLAPRRLLFASAPFGPFFAELAAALEQQGCDVLRLCFEGGDVWETPARNRLIVPRNVDFERYVSEVLQSRRINALVTFNDVLPRNAVALEVAKRMHVDRYVLENGYLRPHWVTLEQGGVNGFSGLPRSRDFYLSHRALRLARRSDAEGARAAAQLFPARIRDHVGNTILHFLAATAASPVLGFQADYYGDSVWRQMRGYVREYLWRQFNSEADAVNRIKRAKACEGTRVFTVLMQKPGDGQLVIHSTYGCNNNFLLDVVASFARCAPADSMLVVKQHPLDYGVEGSPEFARRLFKRFGIESRAVYLRMTSIDVCMDNSDALVTVNSTGGLAALHKGLAVKCMGNAVYDVDGLTFQGALDEFWVQGKPAEDEVLEGYTGYLLQSSQMNGGFHSPQARALLIPQMVDRLRYPARQGSQQTALPL
jgi:capsular polysaccharide export protein